MSKLTAINIWLCQQLFRGQSCKYFLLSGQMNKVRLLRSICQHFAKTVKFSNGRISVKIYLYNVDFRKQLELFKDVRGWQFLTMKAAETLCIVCLPPEKHIY